MTFQELVLDHSKDIYLLDNDVPCATFVFQVRTGFLAYSIRISEILDWVRNLYLTLVILLRLSQEGCALVVLELMHAGSHLSIYLPVHLNLRGGRKVVFRYIPGAIGC